MERRGAGRVASSARYRVKFSAGYKGPSRVSPKAGFTALLVNLAVCAYIFKTHFDPPGWKGSHCRRQFPAPPLAAPRPPSPRDALRGCFFLFTRGRATRTTPTDAWTKASSRTLPPPLFTVRRRTRRQGSNSSQSSDLCHFNAAPVGSIKLLIRV